MYGGDIAAIGGSIFFLATLVLWFNTTEGK
jgi:hypothetical protein